MQLVSSLMVEWDVQRGMARLWGASERRRKEIKGRRTEKLCFPEQTQRSGSHAHYPKPRNLLHPVNKCDNSCTHQNPGLTGSKQWYVNYQALAKQDVLLARDMTRPRDTSKTLPDDPRPAALARHQKQPLLLLRTHQQQHRGRAVSAKFPCSCKAYFDFQHCLLKTSDGRKVSDMLKSTALPNC